MASKSYTVRAETDPITGISLVLIALCIGFLLYLVYEIFELIANPLQHPSGLLGTIFGWLGLTSPPPPAQQSGGSSSSSSSSSSNPVSSASQPDDWEQIEGILEGL